MKGGRRSFYVVLCQCFLLCWEAQAFGQTAQYPQYSSPVHHEMILAGNFGEPRPNHFHGGIDIKTGGVEGKPIFSIGGGYVSKVSVGLYGFGNAVYVHHPEGYTSVYCHLKKFTPQLTSLLRKQQYAHRRAEGEFLFRPSDYPVAEGQLIAVSGNTGASTAPHLHLEIHDTRTWDMLDPLDFIGQHLADTQPPQGHAIMVYPKEGEGVFAGGTAQQSIGLSSHDLPQHYSAWGKVGFGIWANDYMEATYNHYGIRRMEFLVDGQQVFASDVSGIPVRQNLQVNAWGDYDHYLRSHVWYMKAFLEPGVTLPILKADANRGWVTFDEEREYHLCFVLTDFKGNQSRYSFTVEGRPSALRRHRTLLKPMHVIRPDRLCNLQMPGLQLVTHRFMVAKPVVCTPQTSRLPNALSDSYRLTDRSLPLFDYQPIGLRLKKDVRDPSKLYIAARWGTDQYMGGDYSDGWVWGRAREMGATYRIEYDDQPPAVRYLGMTSTHDGQVLRLSISDPQSGIRRYEGFIDGEFVLLEPVAKTTTVECRLRHSPIKPTGQKRSLVVTAEDNRQNRQTLQTQIIY